MQNKTQMLCRKVTEYVIISCHALVGMHGKCNVDTTATLLLLTIYIYRVGGEKHLSTQ